MSIYNRTFEFYLVRMIFEFENLNFAREGFKIFTFYLNISDLLVRFLKKTILLYSQ